MKTMKHKTLGAMSLLLAATAFSGASLPAHAQDTTATSTNMTTETNPMTAPFAAPDENPWRFGVTLPLWAPQINGNVTAFGRKEDVDVSFNQLREHLDASLSLGLNAQKGKFGVFSSVGYMKFSAGDPQANMGLKFLIVNGGLSYLLVKTDWDHPFVLAGTAGVRYWYADTSITIPAFGIIYDSRVQNVVDPVLGLRASQYLTDKLHLDIAGDGGGFNLNNNTDWTWSISGMAAYDFAKWFSVSAGYSALALDERVNKSHGTDGVNLIFNGVAINLTVKF